MINVQLPTARPPVVVPFSGAPSPVTGLAQLHAASAQATPVHTGIAPRFILPRPGVAY